MTTRAGALAAFLFGLALLIAPRLLPLSIAESSNIPAASVKGRIEIIPSASRKSSSSYDASGVVVWLTSLETGAGRSGRLRGKMVQKGKRFSPHILAVEVGTEVDFPNEDPFFHNVFSIYDGRRFDLGLYASGESRPVNFSRPGVSYIFCNIHPQMSAAIIAVNTPYYAVTGSQGLFGMDSVASGKYQLQVWHERSTAEHLDSLTRTVEVNSNTLDLGVIKVSEEGYIPTLHRNKYGQEYDLNRNRPAYRKP
jgi:plastocyanin